MQRIAHVYNNKSNKLLHIRFALTHFHSCIRSFKWFCWPICYSALIFCEYILTTMISLIENLRIDLVWLHVTNLSLIRFIQIKYKQSKIGILEEKLIRKIKNLKLRQICFCLCVCVKKNTPIAAAAAKASTVKCAHALTSTKNWCIDRKTYKWSE